MESTLDKLMSDKSKSAGSNYMSVLLLLLRLRQACNHPLLVSKDFKKDAEAVDPPLRRVEAGMRKMTALSPLSASSPSSGSARCAPLC
ncbi:hypothetical protein FA13DRAFT_1139149 [Coprinellus micaceus]|uniref:SNF2 N-terminal domain-containing protein n=1 Tax=Coprinellus micaceus TaxID=71717 RepID=A0A4Y7RJG4_COPMI|nr:hypothetical protein FA13DRAFT_1139149 [Coprinellus micaceus]